MWSLSAYIISAVLTLTSGDFQSNCEVNNCDFTSENSVNSEHGFELTQSLNLARQEHIQQACHHLAPNYTIEDLNSHQLEHILVDYKHKLLYCYVPKVACTNWKRIFMILSDKWNTTDVLSIPATLAHSPGMFPSLANVSKEERLNLIENFNKLIFVRHPFERLLSAYRNKLEGDSPSARYFQTRVGKRIIKSFRKNSTAESLQHGNDVTFEEFARFLTTPNGELADVVVNEHWKAITKLCHPCAVKYTLVGKYETLLDDSILALHMVNATHVPFPRDTRTSGTAQKLKKYFNPLPLSLIKKLYKIYEYDFKIFNYSLEDILGFELG